MKLKVYIIRKKQLIWAAIILAILIVAAILVISLRTKSTMSKIGNVGTRQTTRADINNDGKFDTIVAKADEKTGNISVSVSCSDGNGYVLEPDTSIKTLGVYNSWWPMNVSIHDINGDNKAEIVLQSSDGKDPILHIFSYKNNKMERLIAGKYSTFGYIKNPRDLTQTLILGTKVNNELKFSYFNAKSERLAPQTVPTALTLGKDTLNSLISYLEKEDVETFGAADDDKLADKISKGSFLDSKIVDAKYSEYNIPSEYTYILRTSTTDSNLKEYSAYKVKLSLAEYNSKSPKYHVTSVEEIKN